MFMKLPIMLIFMNFAYMEEDQVIKEIGERLTQLRKAKSISSEDFANQHDLGRVHYWRQEKGSNLTIKSLARLLKIHGISFEEFFKGM